MLESFIAGFLLLILALLLGRAKGGPRPMPSRSARGRTVGLPVLEYVREDGDQVLLSHEMTYDERTLFQQMDEAVASASDDDDIEADYAIVEAIGSDNGLTRNQSVAFWTRTTFSIFEPEEFDPRD